MKLSKRLIAFSFVLAVSIAVSDGESKEVREPCSSSSLVKLLKSKKVLDREQAMRDLAEYSGAFSNKEFSKFLYKGLSDVDPKVRLAAVEAIEADFLRMPGLDKDGRIEALLWKLASEITGDIHRDKVENTDFITRVSIEAFAALQVIKYNKIPFANYCEWEGDDVVYYLKELENSKDMVNRYGAVRLCSNIKCGKNEILRANILRKLLHDDSEQVRVQALLTVASFDTSIEGRPEEFATYVSLRPEIERLAGDSSFKQKSLAATTLLLIDAKLASYEKNLGIEIKSQRSRNLE